MWPVRLYYRSPRDATSDTPFHANFVLDASMKYLVDEHGGWHVSRWRDPLLTDPPPDECYFDHDVPCFD